MQAFDRGHYFETDASQAEQERKALKSKNDFGNPIVMKSKILAAILDPHRAQSSVFVAEAAGSVRHIDLPSARADATYIGPKAPVTCLAVGGEANAILFAGCWDKDIWSWNVKTTEPSRKYIGHSDFVKTIITTTISNKHILISGGADKKILIWDIETGRRLHTLQDSFATMLAVQHLAIDPINSNANEIYLASASSDPNIRRWKVTLGATEQLQESFLDRPDAERLTIAEHQTSVYKLLYEDHIEDGDDCNLWTASADGTARCLERSRNWVTADSFDHGDYVRAVQVTDQWAITAGRNEDVKFWNRTSGKLHCTLEGHYEEITDLVLLRDSHGLPSGLCSVSIDGTVRTWPLTLRGLTEVLEKMEDAKKPKDEDARLDNSKESALTAAEEAELAELMDDE